jgi:diaminohydroxyphosphoribosylaminopyrimidine deaminase / 5-amino-6-(5-phosphoribosylamino)uracil reductase
MYTKDEVYHQRCLELAQSGLGRVSPNPMVGSVIVFDGKIIGEGYHKEFGGPHAEVNAINSVQDKELLSKSTLYVNLEPCAHHGKTPPCADLIIEKKIPRVVICHRDPFSQVAGRGIEKLINAGIEVSVGTFEKEARFLNRRFLTFQEKKRPFIILKWAETSDGFIDIKRTSTEINLPTWITDELARTLVHKWRTEEQAILIGTNTALYDNPMLNARNWEGKSPIRMILDRTLRLPNNLHVFDTSIPTIIFTEKNVPSKPNIEFVKIDFTKLIDEINSFCYKRQIQSVIIEGGTKLLSTYINNGLWDEARVFKGEITFGDGIKAPVLNEIHDSAVNLYKSELFMYYNSQNHAQQLG